MKIYRYLTVAIFFAFITSLLAAQSSSLTSRFKFWLLNNEARAFSSLSFDHEIISQFSNAFSFIPHNPDSPFAAAEKLWQVHRKLYIFLDEIEHSFNAAARFGNGRLSIVIKKARPEIWSQLAFNQVFPGMYSVNTEPYRKSFYNDLISILDLNKEKDQNLSTRLKRATEKLSDQEFRLFNSYLNSFAALFPGDKTPQLIRVFLEEAKKENFATGVALLLKPELLISFDNSLTAAKDVNEQTVAELKNPLAELEKLAEGSSLLAENDDQQGQSEQQENSLDAPEPGVENLFNIWD
jgi:hypothetical protein